MTDPLQPSLYYRGQHPKYKWYAHFKYKMDPCYVSVAAHIPPESFTVDLGSGIGMLPAYLHCMGEGRRALGVEWDAEKVQVAQSTLAMLPEVQVVHGDVRTFEIPQCDRITIVDLLHYYDRDVQLALMRRCRAALLPGGKLLIRDGDASQKKTARVTRIVEDLSTRFGWNKGPQVAFRSAADLKSDLESCGFAVELEAASAKTHPGNVLLVATKKSI